MALPEKLDWSMVFNTNHKIYGFKGNAIIGAESSGYKYFIWNDRVYQIHEDGYATDTHMIWDKEKSEFRRSSPTRVTFKNLRSDSLNQFKFLCDAIESGLNGLPPCFSGTIDYCISKCIEDGIKIDNAEEVLHWLYKNVNFK